MYVVNAERQRELLRRLTEVSSDRSSWRRSYTDPTSGQQWILFYHRPEQHGGGRRVLRTDPPPPDLASWLRDCLLTGDSDDPIGVAWELSDEYERWPAILDWLEQNLGSISTGYLRTFLRHLTVLEGTNRRPILGKHFTEIDDDHAHFSALAHRANRLLGDA